MFRRGVSALATALALAGCSRCDAPARGDAACGEAGIVHSASRSVEHGGRTREVRAEIVSLACSAPAALPSKAPTGAPCTHHSVCSAARCPCAGGASFLARVCLDGHCAGDSDACTLAPAAIGRSACP